MPSEQEARAHAAGRVAFVCYHTSPVAAPGAGDAGGMNVYVRELAAALAARGVAVDVFTRGGGGDRVVDLRPGARVVPVAAERLSQFAARIAAHAPGRYDLVHSHYWQSGLAAIPLAAGWDVPLVHTHHTVARVKNRFLPDGDAPEPRARLEAEERVVRAAALVTASTAAEREELRHPRTLVLHPGVDHDRFRPGDRASARARLGLAGDERVLVAVGRIQRLKGLELALRAVALLQPRPLLLLAGGASGPEGEAELARLRRLAAALGLAGRVRFLGRLAHDELPALYRAADVALVCSHSESFGLAALEAHACGAPVVGTAVGGLPAFVEEGRSGHLVGSRDPAAFAERIRPLLADSRLRAAYAAAAVRSASRFSWQRTARTLHAQYAALTRGRCGETPRRSESRPAPRSPQSAPRTSARSGSAAGPRPART